MTDRSGRSRSRAEVFAVIAPAEESARHQALIREVNERVATLNEGFEIDGRSLFLCECADSTCIESLELTPAEYERVRAGEVRFVVVPGHQVSEVERVVEENSRFFMVERVGSATTTERVPHRHGRT